MATTIAPAAILALTQPRITHHTLLDLAVVELPLTVRGVAYTIAALFSRRDPAVFLTVRIVPAPKPRTWRAELVILEQALAQIAERQWAAEDAGDQEAAQLWQDMAEAVRAYQRDTIEFIRDAEQMAGVLAS